MSQTSIIMLLYQHPQKQLFLKTFCGSKYFINIHMFIAFYAVVRSRSESFRVVRSRSESSWVVRSRRSRSESSGVVRSRSRPQSFGGVRSRSIGVVGALHTAHHYSLANESTFVWDSFVTQVSRRFVGCFSSNIEISRYNIITNMDESRRDTAIVKRDHLKISHVTHFSRLSSYRVFQVTFECKHCYSPYAKCWSTSIWNFFSVYIIVNFYSMIFAVRLKLDWFWQFLCCECVETEISFWNK